MPRSLSQYSITDILPVPIDGLDLNTCPDPECGNYGIPLSPTHQQFRGRGASQRKQLAAVSSPAIAAGLGAYKLGGASEDEHISSAFVFSDDEVHWTDGKVFQCQHRHNNGSCNISVSILSNRHLLDEVERLQTQNGVIEGPTCGNCGAKYLKTPDDFVFNGVIKSKAKSAKNGQIASFRLLHKPCKGKPGSRISVSLDHDRQQKRDENIRILRQIVNGSGFNDLIRLLRDPAAETKIGVSRIYSRIFWLEKTLLAFEQARLKEWKATEEKSGKVRRRRIAHDDIVIGLNWETAADRRITPIYFSVSADISSGYVYRIDGNFDTTVRPVEFIANNYVVDGEPANLWEELTQASGHKFMAPLQHFHRPGGRFDEASLFASAESQLKVFQNRVLNAYDSVGGLNDSNGGDTKEFLESSDGLLSLVSTIRTRFFNYSDNNRDHRGSFSGVPVRQSYTKAAHLLALRGMLPKGPITLVGEQEATMTRVIPHIFRDMINDDEFEWLVINFDKNATKPKVLQRIKEYQSDLQSFREQKTQPNESEFDLRTRHCAARMQTVFKATSNGNAAFPIDNFRSKQFPRVWISSPVQTHGETNKVVGFPTLRKERRMALKQYRFDEEVDDEELRLALARRMLSATLQPVSSFMNSLRSRISQASRAPANGARVGGSYISGAAFRPDVLIALINIYRVYFNWFEPRQYTGAGGRRNTKEVEMGNSVIRDPITGKKVVVPKRRKVAPVLETPAMRLGADKRKNAKIKPLDPSRVLYRPWLYHGTPLWLRFEDR